MKDVIFLKKLRHKAAKNVKKARNLFYQPNADAILLFGLNKSGTTAAINLIASRAGLSFFDDFNYHLGGWESVLKGNQEFIDYLRKHSYAFSKDIIRFDITEKSIELARSFFKMERYIITIRNPVDNIKSILSRLKIPGTLKSLDVSSLDLYPGTIRLLTKSENYIDSLVQAWIELYANPLTYSDRAVIFKYEDFLADKVSYITSKVLELGLEPRNSINHLIDIQYQPKGTRVSNLEFFGKQNYERIYSSTYSIAERYGY